MLDDPSASTLLESIERFLAEEVRDKLEGRTAYQLRVAVNALGIARRELELSSGHAEQEAQRLTALLRESLPLREANQLLCDRIRSGLLDARSPGLLSHLRQTTLDKLAIDQPRYSGYRQALRRAGSGGGPAS